MGPAMTAPPRSASVLLADALRLLEDQQGWEDIALEVIEAAQQRLAGVPLTEELEMWLLFGGAARRGTVDGRIGVVGD